MLGWFKRDKSTQLPATGEPLVPVPVPPLVTLLAHREQDKGSPLTEDEVNEMRDNCVCINLPLSKAPQMAEARGYDDLDPEHAWEHWQVVRDQLQEPNEGA